MQTATNGEEAFQAILHDPPDVLLLDLYLPRLNGHDLLRRLNDMEMSVDLIYTMSGYADTVDAQECLRLGAVDHLLKPIDLDRLLRSLRLRLGATHDAGSRVGVDAKQYLDHLAAGRPGASDQPSSTWNDSIMPACRCSAMWQCIIQSPGLVISTRKSTVDATGTMAVSFHTRLRILHPVHLGHQETLAVYVDRMIHRVDECRDR